MAVVIGIGNPMRGDDGVGAAVVNALDDGPDLDTFAFDGDGLELMVLWEGRHDVIIVDATQSDAPAGTVTCYEAHEHELPQNLFRHSTHQFGVVEAVEMARTLGQLPDRLILYGVEGERYTLGTGLSPSVQAQVIVLVEAIQKEVEGKSHKNAPKMNK